ncbi:hypothetical protein AHAS_Ahas20G0055500 [Arachis hypogaea]
MQRLSATLYPKVARPACDVFINHRGIDTKRNIAGLLYDSLTRNGVRSFLDSKNMKPGDRLFDHIDRAIVGSKVGVAVFSPRYCDSYFCLHELALLMESRKRVVPIFFDVKPSNLRVKDNGTCPPNELRRFDLALQEAKNIVGLTFDSSKGDWSELLRDASDAVMVNLMEKERLSERTGDSDDGGSASYIGKDDKVTDDENPTTLLRNHVLKKERLRKKVVDDGAFCHDDNDRRYVMRKEWRSENVLQLTGVEF